MKIACIIPARLKSSRFPKKIFALLQGKPLLQWVWEAAKSVSFFDSVTIAVDADETTQLIDSFDGISVMTSENCPTGTHRLCELAANDQIDADIVVNWQCDEPFIHELMIQQLLQTARTDTADIWTLKKTLHDPEEIISPHKVKVVTDSEGHALYFSRHPIPYQRGEATADYYKHIGIYAYRTEVLKRLAHLPTTMLAEAEQLEQLNFLYHGFKIRVHETEYEGHGIDIPEHLEQAHALLAKKL